MQTLNILGAVTLTTVGFSCLAISLTLWRRAGIDPRTLGKVIQALS